MTKSNLESGHAAREAVQSMLDNSARDGDTPLWTKALASSPAVLQEVAAERGEGYRHLTQEEQAMVSFAVALIIGDERRKQEALARLRGLAWSDQKLTNFSWTVGVVMRRVTIMEGLGIDTPSDTSNVIVSLPNLDGDLAKQVHVATGAGETPKWAMAMSHQPEMLRRVLRDTMDVGFTSEHRAMVQLVAGALVRATKKCPKTAAAKLRDHGWSDAKLVELVTMVATEERDRVLFSGLGV